MYRYQDKENNNSNNNSNGIIELNCTFNEKDEVKARGLCIF